MPVICTAEGVVMWGIKNCSTSAFRPICTRPLCMCLVQSTLSCPPLLGNISSHTAGLLQCWLKKRGEDTVKVTSKRVRLPLPFRKRCQNMKKRPLSSCALHAFSSVVFALFSPSCILMPFASPSGQECHTPPVTISSLLLCRNMLRISDLSLQAAGLPCEKAASSSSSPPSFCLWSINPWMCCPAGHLLLLFSTGAKKAQAEVGVVCALINPEVGQFNWSQ